MKIIIVKLIVLCLLLSGCAGTVSTVDDSSSENSHVYQIDQNIADRILLSAMETEFEEDKIEKITAPFPGYSSIVRWGLDKDRVSAVMRASLGKNKDGDLIEGLAFEVSHKGTAPIVGKPTSKRILERIIEDAKLVGEPAVFVEYSN